MATKRRKLWRQPWVWVVAVPVVIVAALTGSHQSGPTTTAAAQTPSVVIVTTTQPPVTTTTTTVAAPTTTVAPPAPRTTTTTTRPPAPPKTTKKTPQKTTTHAVVHTESTCGAPDNPLGYNYCGRGSLIRDPSPDTCLYFDCIGNWDNGKGYMEECSDGHVSMSGGRRGSCSDHGGDARPVYQG